MGYRGDHARRFPSGALPDAGRGPYRVQADLAAVHAVALDVVSTDWLRMVALYDELMAIHPSPVVGLNRAIAVGMSDGPLAGLSALERVAAELPDFHLVAAARAELLARAGRLGGGSSRVRSSDRVGAIRAGTTPARSPPAAATRSAALEDRS